MVELRNMTDPELPALMTECGNAISRVTGGLGFVLVISDDGKVGQFITNYDRSDAIQLMRDTAWRMAVKDYVARVEFPDREGGDDQS